MDTRLNATQKTGTHSSGSSGSTGSKTGLFFAGCAMVLALTIGACASSGASGMGESVDGSAQASVQASVQDQDLTRRGAQVWAGTCYRCHNVRPADQYSADQWPVIVDHMRTRAHLTRSDAEAVTAFLQDLAEQAGR